MYQYRLMLVEGWMSVRFQIEHSTTKDYTTKGYTTKAYTTKDYTTKETQQSAI